MTIDELKALLPPDHQASIIRGRGFWRCMIQDSMGRPVGIGEDADPLAAVKKAYESFRRDKR